MLRLSRDLFLLLALVVIPSTAAASAGISVYRYPGVFSNPWTPISIDYHITADWNWCPWTEYGPPNIYLDYVEIAGSNGFNQISYSPSGSFYDSSPKPKEDISYSVSARLLCSDWDGSPRLGQRVLDRQRDGCWIETHNR